MGIPGLSNPFANLSFGLFDLRTHQNDTGRAIERLSTGKRINRGADDPSGLQAATKLTAREHAIESTLKGFVREESFLGAQEGGLSVMSDLLVDLNALTVSAANSGAATGEELTALKDRAASIIQGIDQIAGSARFNDQPTLTGFGASDLAIAERTVSDPDTGEERRETLTLSDLPRILLEDPELAQRLAEDAGSRVARRRGAIGNRLNEIDARRGGLMDELENTTAARSIIEDADVAKEASALARSRLLEQATIQTIQIQREQAASLLGLLDSAAASPQRGTRTGL